MSHTARSIEEVDEIVRHAEKSGAKIGKTQDEDWGYSVTLTDPDGHHWEIVYLVGAINA